MKTAISLLLILVLSPFTLVGQDRYMVFFKDKANSSFSVNNPSAFLSERSISRRLKNQVVLTEEDVPVNSSYVDQVRDLGVETYYTSKWMNGVLVQMEATTIPLVQSLDAVDRIEFVAPGTLLTARSNASAEFNESPIPPSRISQSQFEILELDLMHQAGFFGRGVLVGVFDDGFDNYNSLPAFEAAVNEGRIVYTQDFSRYRDNVDNDFDHGLRAFSLIGADDQNLIGGAPGAQFFLAVTEASGEYRIEEYNWLFAAERADSAGVDVITSSLGYSDFDDDAMDYTIEDMDGQTTVVTRAANMAASKGIVVISSAGNTGGGPWGIITAPADGEDVIAVGAINRDQFLAGFSASGPSADGRIKPDVVAQGVSNPVLRSTGNIAFQNGTSFSAPLITSLAVGLIEAFPEMTASQIGEVIRESGDKADNPDNRFGYGIPGFIRASSVADKSLISVAEGIATYPNPTELSYVTVAFSKDFLGKSIAAQLVSNRGALVQSFQFTPQLFQSTLELDLSKLQSGLFLLRFVTPRGVITKKIIKSR